MTHKHLLNHILCRRKLSGAALALGLSACAPSTVVPQDPLESSITAGAETSLEARAAQRVGELDALMASARQAGIDVTREETAIWFAREFLKFADWDEANRDAIEYMFVQYGPFKSEAADYADRVPDFQREKVIEVLDGAIETLTLVMDGEIERRPVAKVDWQNITVGDDALFSNGKPVFLYDYFSKSVGRPLTDTQVYNDHLGAIYHGGQRLYEVNKDRAVNSYLLNEDGTFDEERLSYITEIPDTNVGFLILWNMGIPDWVLKREPEAAFGRSLFTGFDIDNPLVRDVWSRIIRKAGELTAGKKVTQLGYILSNEPHWYSEAGHWTKNVREMTEISSYTLDKFRAWLERTYEGDIGALNANWNSAFQNFDAVTVTIPIDKGLRGKPIWYDWSRYNMDRSIDWFTYLQGELLAANPDADTHLKIMPNMFTDNNRSHGIDVEALTNLTTMIGDDAKTRAARGLNSSKPESWEERYAYFWEELSMAYDFMESVSPGKIHVNSETHFLSASWWRELDTDADYVRSVFWLATIQGMDVALSWFWARDPDGSPEDRLEGELNFFDPALAGSYAGSVNMQPHIANEKTQVMMDMNSFSEEIMSIRGQRRPLRLFYSETSAINKTQHMTEQFEMYEALFFEGFPIGFATETVLKTQDPRSWDAILVYKTEYVTDEEFAALQSYLDAGGTVILDSAESLAKNEYGAPRAEQLQAANGSLITRPSAAGIEQLKSIALEETVQGRPDIMLSEDNGTAHKGCVWRVVKTDTGYLVNILNIGKHPARLTLSGAGDAFAIENMLTGQAVQPEFELEPMGVLLLSLE